jgi:serine/threonine protein phosphatase 1
MLGLLRRKAAPPRVHRVPAGQRVYAIGDIHGRRDCLDQLLDRIAEDDAARGPAAATTIVFLGDFVDRGADSRGVVERGMAIARTHDCRFLMGNHEEVFIKAWEGDTAALRLFHRIGGRETLLSYGVAELEYDRADFETLTALMRAHVPADHIAFLRRFDDSFAAGDYLFVHAGIRPGRPIEEQDPADLRWIRTRFLDDPRDHGMMIVHGHTVTADVEHLPNRIGIDTGAYASGRLTALGLEGADRWFLSS